MSNFYISITNGLLEAKHVAQMGDAVWLYMWLIDKTTSINENGVGKVLGSKPITFDEVTADLGMAQRTYRRWIQVLRDVGYINTVRTPHGLVISVNKAKKTFKKRSAKTAHHNASETKSDVPKRSSDVPKSSPRSAKTAHVYIDNTTNVVLQGQLQDHTNIGELSPAEFKELVSKKYYEAIQALDIPVRNHNNLRSALSKMAKDKDRDKTIRYLEFMATQFAATDWKFKPFVTEALEIHDKRAKIRETFGASVKQQNKPKGRGFRITK